MPGSCGDFGSLGFGGGSFVCDFAAPAASTIAWMTGSLTPAVFSLRMSSILVVILGMVGNQLNAALKTRHGAGEFAKLVIGLAQEEVKRRVVRRFRHRVGQCVHGAVITPGVEFPLRVGKRGLCGASR